MASGFRTRSPERDHETDRGRLSRMTAFLEQIAAEIRAEQAGLQTRYHNEVSDAGFLLAAMENDEVSGRSKSRAQELTTSIMRSERRLETLSRQAALMRDMVHFLDRFLEEPQTVRAGSEPARASA
jgi:hypothetical protein